MDFLSEIGSFWIENKPEKPMSSNFLSFLSIDPDKQITGILYLFAIFATWNGTLP